MAIELPHDAVRRDGGRVVIRALRPDDGPAIAAGFERLSPRSRFMRFFSAMPRLSPTVLGLLTAVDGVDHVAIAAFDPDKASDVGADDGLGIGVARYIRSVVDPTAAEAAVAVIDDYHGRGIGTMLLSALGVAARANGIERFEAELLSENEAMRRVFADLGGRIEPVEGDRTVVRAVIDAPGGPTTTDAPAYGLLRHIAGRGTESP